MEWLFSWEVTSFAISIFIAIGLGVLALDDFRVAKLFFLLAAADAIGAIIMWGIKTDLPPITRIPILFLVGGVLVVLLAQSFRYVARKEEDKAQKSAGGPAPTPPLRPDEVREEPHGTSEKPKEVPTETSNKASSKVVAVPKRYDTTDKPKAKVEHPSQSIPPAQQTIIQTAPYGNLAKRCENLGDGIIGFANQRNQTKPAMDPRTPANEQQFWGWYRSNDGQFHFYFYEDAKALQKDLAVVNIKDRRLDELIERHEHYFVDRNRQQPEFVRDNSMSFHLSIEEIEEVGERFKFLATQIPR